MMFSRRVTLALSAILAVATTSIPSFGDAYAGDDLYLPNPKLPAISYAEARERLDAALKLLIDTTQRDFAIQYTDAQKELIRARIWNGAQLELNKFFQPKEPNG